VIGHAGKAGKIARSGSFQDSIAGKDVAGGAPGKGVLGVLGMQGMDWHSHNVAHFFRIASNMLVFLFM
jgi:hypothetical protein